MRTLWWQLKQFFQPFPAPGSWAYRLIGWQFNRRNKKEKREYVHIESSDGDDRRVKLTYEGPPGSFDYGFWTTYILGWFSGSEIPEDLNPDDI